MQNISLNECTERLFYTPSHLATRGQAKHCGILRYWDQSQLCVGFFLCLYHHSTTVMIASNCPLNHTRLSGKGISSQRFFSSLMSVADDTLCT